jgi:hypothetical protein
MIILMLETHSSDRDRANIRTVMDLFTLFNFSLITHFLQFFRILWQIYFGL